MVSATVLECPRISPQWEFYRYVALVKPQFKGRVAHLMRTQVLPQSGRRLVERIVREASPRFSRSPVITFHARDALRFSVAFDDADDLKRAQRVSARISRALPKLWFRFNGRLLHAGRFYRAQGRYRLVPQSSPSIRLPYELYALVAGNSGAA